MHHRLQKRIANCDQHATNAHDIFLGGEENEPLTVSWQAIENVVPLPAASWTEASGMLGTSMVVDDIIDSLFNEGWMGMAGGYNN
jgi:hypothetical protein